MSRDGNLPLSLLLASNVRIPLRTKNHILLNTTMERPTNSRKLFSKIIGMESKTASRVQLLATLFFFILSLFLVTNSLKLQPTDHQCLQSMNSWSPALDSVRYHWETFQNGFARKTNYKGPPLVETEAAWDNLRQGMQFFKPKRTTEY